jgi:AcrR family transcriptional regulator
MGRPRSIDNQTIVDAARRLFLAHGYQVSTGIIAREIGISEGTLFKRFATKEQLFGEAMGIRPFQPTAEVADALRQGRVRHGLVLLATELMRHFGDTLPKMMLLWSTPSFDKTKCATTPGFTPPPVHVLARITELLELAGAAAQRTPKVSIEVAARMFSASMHQFVFFQVVGIASVLPMTAPHYVSEVVTALLLALDVQEEPPA